jgi:hypothetical protein
MRKARENQSKFESLTAAGEVILVPTQGPMGTICGAPLCFATLAYMNQVDEREKFILAVRSSQRKRLMKPQGIRLPDTLRGAFPKMRERKAQGAWNMGRKRIHHRVTMGSLGWAVFAGDGVRYLYSEPTSDGKIGLELHGVGSLTKGVREILRQKKEGGAYYVEPDVYPNPSAANEMHLWAESMPVLHLAMAVSTKFEAFDPNLSDDEKLFCLLHTSDWLLDTLKFAEQLRPILHGRISRFDPNKALRLIPSESQ